MGRQKALNRVECLFAGGFVVCFQCWLFQSLRGLETGGHVDVRSEWMDPPAHDRSKPMLQTTSASSAASPLPPRAPLLPRSMDILSIGSRGRLDYLQAQYDTFGSHPTIRHFFNVTEDHDTDPNCAATLALETNVQRLLQACHSRPTNSSMLQGWKRYFAPPSILLQQQQQQEQQQQQQQQQQLKSHQTNPAGWLCAQSRPATGLYQVLEHYRHALDGFPDYLLLTDDDTYWNIEDLLDRLPRTVNNHNQNQNHNHSNNHSLVLPRVWTGCLLRLPPLWIPHGGFGMIWNRAMLQAMTTPISCQYPQYDSSSSSSNINISHHQHCSIPGSTIFPNRTTTTTNANAAATTTTTTTTNNALEEQRWIRPGMSLVDLMYAYATQTTVLGEEGPTSNPNHPNRTTSFCGHSDWLWGYFLPTYIRGASLEVLSPTPRQASRMTTARTTTTTRKKKQSPRGCCGQEGDHCDSASLVCHRTTPDRMYRIHAGSPIG